MTFPGAGAQIYRNEAGEPVSWDYPGYDEGPDPDDFDRPDYDEEDENAVCDQCGAEFPPEQIQEAAEHTKTCTVELPMRDDDDDDDDDDLPF